MTEFFKTNTPIISIIHIMQNLLDMDCLYCEYNNTKYISSEIPFFSIGNSLPTVYMMVLHCRTLLEAYYKFVENNEKAKLEKANLSENNSIFALSLYKIRNDFSHGWHKNTTTINQINLRPTERLDSEMNLVLQKNKFMFDENYSKKLIACTIICIREISDSKKLDKDKTAINNLILLELEKLICS
jgi:hypothetical protein